MHLAFLPFRLQPPIAPYHRFSTLPLSLIGFLLSFFSSKVWASPFPSRLTVTTGRIEFVVLRTSFSPPVAPHHTSQCRSYVRLQVWKAFYLKGTFTPLALRTFRRTRGRFQTCPYVFIFFAGSIVLDRTETFGIFSWLVRVRNLYPVQNIWFNRSTECSRRSLQD